ncbi:MAG: hypothetical protein GF350_03425, partial [Chitinivibrionales bacterium]|nr:hypothetical protein [Chitinivibrionales bacterium]
MPKLSDLLSNKSSQEKLASLAAENSKKKKSRKSSRPNPVKITGPLVPDFISLDFETTGLDSKKERIIEIGAVRFQNGKAESEYSTFVNPGRPVPPQITQLTGITDDDVRNAPSFSSVADHLLSFIGDLPLCAHQVEFDISFLNESLARISREKIKRPYLDTALISRIVLPRRPAYSLKHIAAALKIPLLEAHRALDDARASGMVALKLLDKMLEIDYPVLEEMAWFAPHSLLKQLLRTSCETVSGEKQQRHRRARPKLPGKLIPEENQETIAEQDVTVCFDTDGPLAKASPEYAERPSQIEMARHVARTLNSRSQLLAEAGPGIGKSFAYLVPAALYATKNSCRIVVSTHTRNLQDQLMTKDLPIVTKAAGDDFRYAVLKGRSNYLCRRRFSLLLSGKLGNLSHRERGAVLPLIRWAWETTTGDIEEQNCFNRKWFAKIWSLVSADSRECTGRQCPFFDTCFLQCARRKALNSHLVVINHALFFSDVCSESPFLGKIDSLIFDEAHHVVPVGHYQLSVEVDTNRFNLYSETINTMLKRVERHFADAPVMKAAKKIKKHLRRVRKSAEAFLKELDLWAEKKRPGTPSYQFAYSGDPFGSLPELAQIEISINEMQEILLQLLHECSAIENNPASDEIINEIDHCRENTSQLKADLAYTARGITQNHVFWIEGNRTRGWVKLCGVPLDVGAILKDVWERTEGAIVFTSATLSVSSSMEYLMQKLGLTGDFVHSTDTKIFESPFSSNQSIRGAFVNAPEPDSPEFVPFAAAVVEKLWKKFKKNILCLFTSNSRLRNVYSILKMSPAIPDANLLAQGISGNRPTLLSQFKEGASMVLLGTDSFWEGIDAPGSACEIVILCRLPFPVPSHPLVEA